MCTRIYYMVFWTHPTQNPKVHIDRYSRFYNGVHNPNGISIGSAAFAGLTIVTDQPTTLLRL